MHILSFINILALTSKWKVKSLQPYRRLIVLGPSGFYTEGCCKGQVQQQRSHTGFKNVSFVTKRRGEYSVRYLELLKRKAGYKSRNWKSELWFSLRHRSQVDVWASHSLSAQLHTYSCEENMGREYYVCCL